MNKPSVKYLVVNVRKSDGQTFFPDNPRHRKGIDDLGVAMERDYAPTKVTCYDGW